MVKSSPNRFHRSPESSGDDLTQSSPNRFQRHSGSSLETTWLNLCQIASKELSEHAWRCFDENLAQFWAKRFFPFASKLFVRNCASKSWLFFASKMRRFFVLAKSAFLLAHFLLSFASNFIFGAIFCPYLSQCRGYMVSHFLTLFFLLAPEAGTC